MEIKTYPMQESTISDLYAIKNEIELDPEYQRQGELWNYEKKRLFIDSILTYYDIPKIYLHYLQTPRIKHGRTYQYAVIDGRQRLETIWGFIENEFSLTELKTDLTGKDLILKHVHYKDLATDYPTIKSYFDNYRLPIVLVETKDDDEDLVEDMFSRLNEAVSINAAEKRNAINGHLVRLIRKLALHKFFTGYIGFDNRRYKHYEVLARLLFLEYRIRKGKIWDTKKSFLDSFVKEYKSKKPDPDLEESVVATLDAMCEIFQKRDNLLRKAARVPIYFLLVREGLRQRRLNRVTREGIIGFNEEVSENKKQAVVNIDNAKPELIEYDRLTIQGTNDASSIRTRFRTIAHYLGLKSDFIYDL